MLKKTLLKLSLFLVTGLLITSCNKDNSENKVLSAEELSELRPESTIVLTEASSKTWKINSAILSSSGNISKNGKNSNGTIQKDGDIDISENFNVVDDEFIFSGNGETGTVEWRKGYGIETNASDPSETLLDKYVSSVFSTFKYNESSATIIEANDGKWIFEIVDDNTLNATITNDDNSILNISLSKKNETDYISVPANGLSFSKAFTFTSTAIACCSPGMIGSYKENAIFLVTREWEYDIDSTLSIPERVLKLDINTNEITEQRFNNPDKVSKQLHLIDDQLIVIGGQYVNQYNVNLTENPVSTLHGKSLSRFGISVIDNNAFMIGGDIDNLESDKIFKWNIDSKTLSEFATLPEPKSGARGTTLHDNLYVFGGSEAFFGDLPSNLIYKINIKDPTNISVFEMDQKADFTFVDKYENLIYVANRFDSKDENGDIIGSDFSIGVFNTEDNTYKTIDTNLINSNGYDVIHQMCIFNGKMYIIFSDGQIRTEDFAVSREWEILVSDLN